MLIIFLLNTVVGFSCALRMSHKDHDEKTEHHEHHRHRVSSLSLNSQNNTNSANSYISKDDPCCQGAVNNFVSLAKMIPQSGKVIIQIPVAYISAYCQRCLLISPGVIAHHQMSFDERQHPPTPDIRVNIQSFQI